MSYTTELTNKQFNNNIILKINGEYYGGQSPDSGLSLDSDKIGVIRSVKIPKTSLDIRRSKTTIGSISFDMVDVNQVISSKAMSSDSNWLNLEVEVYAGFITGSFDFADYILLSKNIITDYSRSENLYKFKAEQPQSLIVDQSFQVFSQLDGDINDLATTISLLDASSFPNSGRARINDEYIQWTSKSGDDLLGVSRADEFSIAEDHSDGDDVFLVTLVEDNPINIMLQILLSDQGDLSNGAFDVLSSGGLGIDQSLIDIASFTDIRDTSLSGDTYRLLLEAIDDTMDYLEEEILQPTRVRFVSKDGKIALAELDVLTLDPSLPDIDETSIVGTPKWKISSKKIINEVIVKWNYSWGEKRFSRTSTFLDQDSIDRYSKRKSITYEFRGITASNNGTIIVTDLANRLLNRLSTATPQIQVSSHFDQSAYNVADDIRLNHRYLPQQGGSLGFSDQLEIISKAVDFNTGLVIYDLEFTSFSGIRIGLIAPSPFISNITSQKTFDVPDGSCYKAGYAVRIFDSVGNDYLPDAVNIINNVSGNTITMVNDFTTALNTNLRLKFATYDDADADQRARYAFTGSNSGFFDDGSKNYQILF